MARPLTFHLLAGEYAAARLESLAGLEAPDDIEPLWSLSVTPDGPTLVCPAADLPVDAQQVEAGWSALAIADQIDLSVAGVCAGVASELAEVGIPILVIPSFTRLFVLIPSGHLTRAITALRLSGHVVESAPAVEAPDAEDDSAEDFTGWNDTTDLADAAQPAVEFTGWGTDIAGA